MRIEEEGSDTEGHNRDPEVNKMREPDRQSNVEQEQQRPHTEVDTGSSESGVENGE